MTQVDPERDVGRSPDALSRPFTPGAPSNDPELATFPETVGGPVPVELTDRRTAEFVDQWRNASYNCYSSGHKFCREVCPVMQVTRNESWTPTAFHANVVAMEKGELEIADVAADYVNCTQCGACELRCPNTLFTGDFYRFRTRTVDVVKAVRALAVDNGVHQPQLAAPGTSAPTSAPTSRCSATPRSARRTSGTGPTGSTSRSAARRSCSSTARRRSTARRVPRAVAQILQSAGYEFGLMGEQWCCGGPAAEMGYVDQARRFAEHNLDELAGDRHEAGARARPARLHQLHRGLPEVLRRRLRHRGRAGRRAARRADPARAGSPRRCRSSGRSRTTTPVGSTSARASGRSRARSCARSPV